MSIQADSSSRTVHRRDVVTLLALTFAIVPPAQAAYPRTPTDFAKLPRYCAARMDQTTAAETARWRAVIGPDFLHIHHYCAGLFTVMLAEGMRNPKDRRQPLGQAIVEFRYVQEKASRTFKLMPEINVQKGKALLAMEQPRDAIREFQAAIALNPRYTPAYGALADYYMSIGELKDARAALEAGLKQVSGSKTLSRRLNRLAELERSPAPAGKRAAGGSAARSDGKAAVASASTPATTAPEPAAAAPAAAAEAAAPPSATAAPAPRP